MNKLSQLKDSELLTKTETLVREERRLTSLVIDHLQEISRRKLYLDRGFSSLMDYCVKQLGYSESAAYRRLSAVSVISEMPELKGKIESGVLSLSNVVQAQVFFRQEAREDRVVSVEKKAEIFSSLEGLTWKEAEKALVSEFPLAVPLDKTRELNSDQTEVRFVASKELMSKLEEIKGLLSHANPDFSYDELFLQMSEIVLKVKSPLRKAAPQRRPALKVSVSVKPHASDSPAGDSMKDRIKSPSKDRSTNGRYISSCVRSEIWWRDGGFCSFRDALTGRVCGSRHQLQVDHIKPLGIGGDTLVSNLRLVCRAHNLHLARRTFGNAKMAGFSLR